MTLDDARQADVDDRLRRLRRHIATAEADGALLASRRNFAWISGGGLNHVLLASERGAAPILVTADEAVVLAPVNEAERLRDEELDGLPIAVEALAWHEADAIDRAARRHARGRLLDDDALEAQLLAERSRLSPRDHERMTLLGADVDAALDAASDDLVAGTSEQAAAATVGSALAAVGARAPVLLAAADDRIARYRHPLPTAASAHRRLMLVVVAERWGLHVAATRTRDLRHMHPELAARTAAVADVLTAMVAATRPGATFGDVFARARDAYAAAGVPDEWRLHHQGGSIGHAARERIATPGDPTRVEPGMAFAWNPSITGAKLERTLLLDANGGLRFVTR